MRGDWYMETCDVCLLLDGDGRHKLCFYCAVCGTWICSACSGNWTRRAQAAWLKKWQGFQA